MKDVVEVLRELIEKAHTTETDPRGWLIQLDYRSWRQLVQSRHVNIADRDLYGIKFDNPKLPPRRAYPLDSPADVSDEPVYEPQLISIQITLLSGRKCYIDAPDNDPIWTEGTPK